MIMATSIYQKSFIERRKEQGLCLKCGKPLDRDGTYCTQCRDIINSDTKETRRWYQEHRICPRCRKNELFGDEKVCLECGAKGYEATRRSRNRLGREHYNNQHKEWARKEHQRRINQGVCTRCGKRKSDGGHKTCGICRAKDRERKSKNRVNMDRRERYKNGLCFFCDNPVKIGYKVCENHYQMNLQKLDNEKCRKYTEDIKKNMKKYFL